jgi:DNA-directed RNA polymerase specialized sigma subunit
MKKRHYVNNKDFYDALVKYRETLQTKPDAIIPDYIGICIYKICEKLSNRPNFSGYSYKEEMISDGLESCLKAVPKFNPEKTNNPFAYFTTTAWNAFVMRIKTEQKEQYVKHKNAHISYLASDDYQYGDTGGMMQFQSNDLSDDIISTYEDRLKKNKKQKVIGVEKFLGDENLS